MYGVRETSAGYTLKVANTTITLDGATIKDSVYGISNTANIDTIATTNTKIIFKGKATSVERGVYGEKLIASNLSQGDRILEIQNTGNKVFDVSGFNKINFMLPNGIKNNDVMLTVNYNTGAFVLRCSALPRSKEN